MKPFDAVEKACYALCGAWYNLRDITARFHSPTLYCICVTSLRMLWGHVLRLIHISRFLLIPLIHHRCEEAWYYLGLICCKWSWMTLVVIGNAVWVTQHDLLNCGSFSAYLRFKILVPLQRKEKIRQKLKKTQVYTR